MTKTNKPLAANNMQQNLQGAERCPFGRYFRVLSAVLLMTAVSGCVVGPDYQKPIVNMPFSWGNKAATKQEKPAQLAEWWKRFNDPLLNALVDESVEGSLTVATAKAKVREARASYRQSVSGLFPSADGTASATRSRTAGGDSGASSTSSLFKSGLDASWEADLFGANKRSVEAAKYGMDSAEEELRNTLLTLIGDVTTNYVEARGYQARIALAKRTAASQRKTAQLTRDKFEAGASSAVDLSNASGQAASTEAQIPDLESSYAQSVHRLSVLTGRAPSALADRMKPVKAIPKPKLPMPTGIPADILLTRPDVRLAERQYAQYTAKVGQAEAARYPSVSLTGSIATSGSQLGDLGKSSSISWSFGPSLSVPIFNAGKLKAAVEVAQAQRDQYFIAYRSSILTALEDVENAMVSLAQERIKSSKLSVSARHYREAASLARSLYQSGTTSFLDLLEADRSLYSAEDSLLSSQVAISTDYIALNKALGGGWSGAVEVAKPEIADTNTGPHLQQHGAVTKASTQ